MYLYEGYDYSNENESIFRTYDFYTDDKEMHPPGLYVFEVTASIAKDIYDSIQFQMQLVDPCTTAEIILTYVE